MLNPWMLIFLPLIALPIVLHLLTRRRLERIRLSTFRFLLASHLQQRRNLRLVQWLLLLLRVAVVALLVLALGRPVLTPIGSRLGGGAGRDVTLALDVRATMALRHDGASSFERAQRAAASLIDQLRPADHLTLLAVGSDPVVVFKGYAVNPQTIRGRLMTMTTTAGDSDIVKALEHVAASRPRGPRTVYLVSDMQAGAWSPLARSDVTHRLGGDVRLVVLDVGASRPVANAGVVGDVPSPLRCLVGLPVACSVTVVNARPDQPLHTHVSVMLDEAQVARLPVSVEPGRSATLPVTITPTRPGLVRGRFEIPGDAFPDDDAFLFCLRVEPAVRVLLVAPPDGADPLDRPRLFLRAALQSAALSLREVSPGDLTLEALQPSDVAILADAPLDTHRGPLLRHFLARGGGVLFLPGQRVEAANYAQSFFDIGDPLKLRLRSPRSPDEAEADPESVAWFEPQHPLFEPFAPPRWREQLLQWRLGRYFPVAIDDRRDEPVQLDGRAGDPTPLSLMKLRDGTTILAEARVGEGKLLVAGFPATPAWTDLPVRVAFVPLLLRAAAHLHRPPEVDMPTTVPPRQQAFVRLDRRWANAQAHLTDPSGQSTTLALQTTSEARLAALTDTARKGFYTVSIQPRHPGAPDQIDLGLAVNLAPDQSRFAPVDDASLRQWLPGVKPLILRASDDDPLLVEHLSRKREFWRWLIWAAFAMVGVEFTLATIGPRPRPSRRRLRDALTHTLARLDLRRAWKKSA